MPAREDHPARALHALVDRVREGCDPGACVRRGWPTDLRGRVDVVAFGKASVAMAAAALERLPARGRGPVLGRALVVGVPERVAQAPPALRARATLLEADHPLPGQRSLSAARAVRDFVATIAGNETLLALISGGGSAHLTLPARDLTLEDLRAVSGALQRAGAPIDELNCVRRHCELLKGGRLAMLSHASAVRCLVLSDVVGDRLDVIASGPFTPDPTTYDDALAVLARHGAADVAPAVTAHLRRGAEGLFEDTPPPGSPHFTGVRHAIVGNNRLALDALGSACIDAGFRVLHARPNITGGAAALGAALAARALRCAPIAAEHARPVAMLLGGEWTVDTAGATGVGGPSQELALAAAVALHRAARDAARRRETPPRIGVLAFSTDGVDGPTDAAGAVVTERTLDDSLGPRFSDPALEGEAALRRHDSHAFLEACGALLRTGPTGTNVNHVVVAVAFPSPA